MAWARGRGGHSPLATPVRAGCRRVGRASARSTPPDTAATHSAGRPRPPAADVGPSPPALPTRAGHGQPAASAARDPACPSPSRAGATSRGSRRDDVSAPGGPTGQVSSGAGARAGGEQGGGVASPDAGRSSPFSLRVIVRRQSTLTSGESETGSHSPRRRVFSPVLLVSCQLDSTRCARSRLGSCLLPLQKFL